MKFHALVIDDNPGVLEDVKDRLEGLGHSCDCASCVQAAREHLARASYSYILLDLEIPVRYGRPSRISNGQNLLSEIRSMKGYEGIPIIVMTTHGHDSPDLAVEVLRCNRAIDYVRKPFPDRGHTLERAIHDALAVSGRSRPGAATRSGSPAVEPPQPFETGEMVFSPSGVELCGVQICGGPESGTIRRILDELRKTNSRGRFVHYDGNELARLVGCERGQNAVGEAVAALRAHVCDLMLAEANVRIDRLHDIILNDRRYGYRLSPKITVRDAEAPANDPQSGNGVLANTGDELAINERQKWVIEQIKANGELRKNQLMEHFRCSPKTAERDLRGLRECELIVFTGPAKTGHWRLVQNY